MLSAPLAGLCVVSVEQYGAGPFGTQLLASLGAEVIKIENPRDGGDVSRQVGPYFTPGVAKDRASLFFQGLNRHKRSVALDLSVARDRKAFERLVAGADALACNLRGDVPAKLGLTYATLGQIKPELVCAHLTAYGRDGPRAAWPGYDFLVQAEAGYFSINGEPGAVPSRFPLSIIDLMAGYAMALGLLAGVLDARRTGRGRDIDVSLFDVGLFNLNYLATWFLNAGHVQSQEPRSAHASLTPCQLYRTSDGWIYIMCNKEKFWTALCAKLGRREYVSDPRFVDFAARLKNRAVLTELLDAAFAPRTTKAWLDELAGQVPCAPVHDIRAALESPYVTDSGRIETLHHPEGAAIRLLRSPILAGHEPEGRLAPSLGADTRPLLGEIDA
ncbi:MAG: CaiB/BaiF CoA transferase family protein [Alphaproteobacteria bacterium]